MPQQDGGEQGRSDQGRDEQGRDEQGRDEQGRGTQDRGTQGGGTEGGGTEGGGEERKRDEPEGGGGAERHRLETDFLLALRRAGSIMQLLGQVSAERIGINVTDLNCLNIVALTGSMTAGDLARATGLTTASITGVLDRLEEGGFVRRERDPHDRRRVIVKLNAGPGLREIGPTFGPLIKAWRATAAGYSDDELRLLLEFQRRFEEIVRDQLARLRGEGDGPGRAGS
jgi:DNA-binding transcriptional ArsR family regulator